MLQLTYLASALALAGVSYSQKTLDMARLQPKNGPYSNIPLFGMGTWNLEGKENTTEAIASAIEAGYRHFDGAERYENQRNVNLGIKEGLRRTGLKRSDLWITTKIWSNFHGANVKSGMDRNLEELGLDYVDLTLIHFPVGGTREKPSYDYVKTWKEMEKYVGEPGSGKPTRFIGISNFNVSMIDELLAAATIKPLTHQFELHPYLQQKDFVDYHKKLGLQITAYATLGDSNPDYYKRGRAARKDAPPPLLKNAVLNRIATARGCSAAQVAIRWALDQGFGTHVKAAQKWHQKENWEAPTKCVLTAEDHQAIRDIEKTHTFRYWDVCVKAFGLPCYTGLERND